MWSDWRITIEDVVWRLYGPYIGPTIIFVAAIVSLAYLLSIAKKRAAVIVSISLFVVALVWLMLNIVVRVQHS